MNCPTHPEEPIIDGKCLACEERAAIQAEGCQQ